jgi:PAS domain S-box-containing protein
VVFDILTMRSTLERRLTTDAEIVGYNGLSALLQQDRKAAAGGLAALRAEPHVRAAAIYDPDGKLFVAYPPQGGSRAFSPPPTNAGLQPGTRLRLGRLEVYRPIALDGTSAGGVYVVSDLSEIGTRLARYGALVLLVSLAALAIAVSISSRYQETVSGPILELARTARTVSREEDYSARAPPAGADEIGGLVRTFNEMLEQIQRRDTELREARDLLERRVEERTRDLVKSQALLADAQRLSHIGSFERDLATNRIVWSDEMYRLFDVEGTHATLESFTAIVHPEDRDRVREILAADTRLVPQQAYDFRIVRKDGAVRIIHADRRVQRAPDGTPLRVVGFAQDVTERRAADTQREEMIRVEAAREEARGAERRAAFLARVSSVLASSLDTEKTLAAATSLSVPDFADWCVLDMTGEEGLMRRMALSHADPAKAAVAERLSHETIRLDADAPAARVAATGRVEVFPPERARASSDANHLALVDAFGPGTVLAAPLKVGGEPRGALLWCRVAGGVPPPHLLLGEVIARRAAVSIEHARLYQSAQQANRLKDEFLATLSHELRTPLHAIVGWAHMLRTGRLDEATAKKAVETIDRNAQAQNQLISDILDVSRIVAGKVRLQMAPLELARVALAAVDTLRPAAEVKNVRLTTALSPDVGAITGDPDRLQQVVWNLLSNAIKFVPRGGCVDIRVEERNGRVELVVTDDGPGIAPEFLPHVFERFRQADSSSTRPHGGLGLGLAIVRHLVELHGGEVSARNREHGTGAVFTASFPRRVAAPGAAGGPSSGSGDWLNRVPELSGVRVLVVDDDADARDMLGNVLSLAGADVRLADGAREALARIERRAPDVLLCDIEMPGEDGYSLIRKVRARGTGVPAAAVTAYASADDRERALKAGFDAHISKPVDPAELVRTVASLAPAEARENRP